MRERVGEREIRETRRFNMLQCVCVTACGRLSNNKKQMREGQEGRGKSGSDSSRSSRSGRGRSSRSGRGTKILRQN